MKPTDHFKQTIQNYLEQRSAQDALFAASYKKPQKNIDDCITYILNEVKKSECNGFSDDEIYSMAVHYYDEDNINPGKPINCRVVVNHSAPKRKKKEPEKKQSVEKKEIHVQQMTLF